MTRTTMDPALDWTRTHVPALSGRRVLIIGVAQDAAHGALPTVAAAGLAGAQDGDHFGPDGRSELQGLPARAWVAPTVTDLTAVGRFWDRCEQLTGVTFEALQVRSA